MAPVLITVPAVSLTVSLELDVGQVAAQQILFIRQHDVDRSDDRIRPVYAGRQFLRHATIAEARFDGGKVRDQVCAVLLDQCRQTTEFD